MATILLEIPVLISILDEFKWGALEHGTFFHNFHFKLKNYWSQVEERFLLQMMTKYYRILKFVKNSFC